MNLRDSIDQLRAVIVRSENELQRMRDALGPGQCPCCVGAAYGGTVGPYDTLARKRDRQDAWLRVLLAKADAPGDLPRASAAYARLVERHGRIR